MKTSRAWEPYYNRSLSGESAVNSRVRLVQLSDTHLRAAAGMAGADADTGLRATLAAMAARGADALLLTGDLAHDDGAPAYARLAALLAPLGLPTLCLAGNHDDPAALAASALGVSGGADLGAWRLVLLDSTLPGQSSGALGAAELERLDATLAAAPQRPALVALHHPPLALGSAWIDAIGLAAPERLFAVLARHPQVRAVVFGHAHQSFAARIGGIRVLGCPSTCVQFRPRRARFALDPLLPPGARWLDLYADGRLTTGILRAAPANSRPDAGAHRYTPRPS